jgi:hypothetical protein
LARVHALDGNEVLSIVLVAVLVTEDNAAKRGTPTRVVKDVLDYALNVTFAFGKVESTEASRSNTLASAALEDGRRAVALSYIRKKLSFKRLFHFKEDSRKDSSRTSGH